MYKTIRHKTVSKPVDTQNTSTIVNNSEEYRYVMSNLENEGYNPSKDLGGEIYNYPWPIDIRDGGHLCIIEKDFPPYISLSTWKALRNLEK